MNESSLKYSRYARCNQRDRTRPTFANPSAHVRKKRFEKLAIIVALLLAFLSISYAVSGSIDGIAPFLLAKDNQQRAAAPSSATASSTPQRDWKQGLTPSLYQIDPQWASTPYAGDTIGKSGCGPTCLSMVYIALTGKKDLNPMKMAARAEQGGYVEAGATSWAFMTEGARSIGLRAMELPADKVTVKDHLSAGHPVIVVVGPGDFTTTGHFIVLCGVDSYGNAIIRDPNSEENTKKTWDIDRIMNQARNLWAFTQR